MSKETIDHPLHYGGDTTYEVIKVLVAWGLDRDFALGNAVKYVARAGKKEDLLEDLRKARWYLDWKIGRIESAAREDALDAEAERQLEDRAARGDSFAASVLQRSRAVEAHGPVERRATAGQDKGGGIH